MTLLANLSDLLARWRSDAEVLRRTGHDASALLCERHADEAEAAARRDGDVPLTIQEASRISGYSVDHLRRLISQGRIPNAGRPHAPRIRRADLPQRPGRVAQRERTTYDPRADARSLRHWRRGEANGDSHTETV